MNTHIKTADQVTLILTIPASLSFSDLKLTRDTVTGDIVFSWAAVQELCTASGVDIALFCGAHEDNVAGLITEWYSRHRKHGGKPDPVAEELLAEIMVEDVLGDGISYPPGRA